MKQARTPKRPPMGLALWTTWNNFVAALRRAFRLGKRAGRAEANNRVHFNFVVEVTSKPHTKKGPMLEIRLSYEAKVRVSINPTTLRGAPVQVQDPEWMVNDGNCTLEVADDGLSAVITSPDAVDETNIIVTGDADLGEGVEKITETIKVTVTDPHASNLGLKADAPEPK